MKKLFLVPLLLVLALVFSGNAIALDVKWQMVDWNAWGRLYDLDGNALNANPYDLSGSQQLTPGYHTPDTTEDAFGTAQVFKISTDDAAGDTLWQLGGGEQLTVFFWGADDVRLDVDPAGGDSFLYTTGFKIEVWLDDTGDGTDFDPTLGPGGRSNPGDDTHYDNVTDDGVMVLSLLAHDLLDENGDMYDIKEQGDAVTGAFFGSGFLDVVDGAWADLYDTDGYNPVNSATQGTADMTISFSTQGNGQNNWTITGTGEAFGGIVIPEPTTIALFGLGLLGFAGIGRRKIS